MEGIDFSNPHPQTTMGPGLEWLTRRELRVMLIGPTQITEQVGGKAAALGELAGAGFPAPAGLCITVDAFHLALAQHREALNAILRKHDLRNQASAQAAAKRISQVIADLTIPQTLATALKATLPNIGDETTLLAVRSSTTREDGAEVSFAGQYISVIGVRGEAAVHDAIVMCWRSFFSPNALVVRMQQDAPSETSGMAVLIQPVIDAECAGICFTVDPVTQQRDRIVVNAAWGFGAGVVDGSVASDTAWIRRDDFGVDRHRIVEKPEQVILDREHGLRRARVPEDRRRAACLPNAWLQRIAQFGIAAEVLFGCPQDMEWAIDGGQIWILQSRPITGLPPELRQSHYISVEWEDDEDWRALWRMEKDRLGHEVLLPLEQDESARLENTFEESCWNLGVEHNVQFKYSYGRVYTRRIPIDWTEAERRIRRAAIEDLVDRLQADGRTTWDHWGPEIVKATERLRAFDRRAADGQALAQHLEEALAVRRRHYMLHPFFDFRPRRSFFEAYAAMAGVTLSEAETAGYRLLDAGETPLTQLVDGVCGLACTARRSDDVTALVTDPPPDAMAQLQSLPHASDFLKQLDALLTVYGERTGHGWGSEVTLRTLTWREQPEKVLPLIAAFLEPSVESPVAVRQRAQRAIEAEVEALCAACDDENEVSEFRRQLAYARKVHAVLEIHNHYVDQMSVGQLRHAVMAAARCLVARGALASAEEALWLRFDEILNALRADAPASFAETVAARQGEHAKWTETEMEAPPLLGLPDAHLPQRPPLRDEVNEMNLVEAADAQRLIGQGASVGRHRGRARVVADSTELPELQAGDVLVAWNVGPLWTPIFPTLGGLILESGSVGQHAAATAREYGVPAVVEVKQATHRIPDGVWVIVDGTTGVVELD